MANKTRQNIDKFIPDADERKRLHRLLDMADSLDTSESPKAKALRKALESLPESSPARAPLEAEIEAITSDQVSDVMDVVSEAETLGLAHSNMIANGLTKYVGGRVYQFIAKAKKEKENGDDDDDDDES